MNEPKRAGRPLGSTISSEGKATKLTITVTPEDRKYLLSVNTSPSIAIRQLIRDHRRKGSKRNG